MEIRYDGDRALRLLREGSRCTESEFRDGQEEAIRQVVDGRGRLLLVQKTGWGKSFVYFIAARLLRESNMGPALLISPLVSLMRNQLEAAQLMGIRANTINSDNVTEWREVEAAVGDDSIDLLLISPERLASARFVSKVLSTIASRVSLLIVDEAHCISDWGHDFRPHYRLLERIIKLLPSNLRVLATTATANNRVMSDLQNVLGPDLVSVKGELNRQSLTLQTIRMSDQAERLAWLAQTLPNLSGSGIIYTLTVRDAERVASWLQSKGLNVRPYFAKSEDRAELESQLQTNEVKALVATLALGMGYDKPDLGFVIHFQSPGSVVTYYQQVGRAGRGSGNAYGVLLSGKEDDDINDFFIDSAFPTLDEVNQILGALERNIDGLSIPELLVEVNIRKGRVEKTVQLLALESPAPVAQVGSKWQLTSTDLNHSFWERADRLTELRRAEQAEMQNYIQLTTGHMQFLVSALDGDPSGIQPPHLPKLPTCVSDDLVRDAVRFLRRSNLSLKLRKQWPAGGMPKTDVRGLIPMEFRALPGRALCVWGDAGWGELVRKGMYDDLYLSDELVDACTRLVSDWAPTPSPTWVTCLPSTRHKDLVPDFARRLATKLGLAFEAVLEKAEIRPQQKTMSNSSQQARNVDGAFKLILSPRSEPVILVDDLVNSGWTMTMAAYLLRQGGAGEVFPLALATTGAS